MHIKERLWFANWCIYMHAPPGIGRIFMFNISTTVQHEALVPPALARASQSSPYQELWPKTLRPAMYRVAIISRQSAPARRFFRGADVKLTSHASVKKRQVCSHVEAASGVLSIPTAAIISTLLSRTLSRRGYLTMFQTRTCFLYAYW